jgi:hypothetical protein
MLPGIDAGDGMSDSVGAILLALMTIGGGQATPRDAAIDQARAAVARELAVGTDRIELLDVVEAEWRDSSLGCPERGMVYPPVMTSGYGVTLGVGRDRFVVHVASGRVVICGKPRAPGGDARDAKLPPAEALVGLRLAEQARVDLAGRLRVGRTSVTVNFFRRVIWPDPGLGCPVNGREYPRQPTSGFRIELASNGKTYEYHSDMNRAVLCPDVLKP